MITENTKKFIILGLIIIVITAIISTSVKYCFFKEMEQEFLLEDSTSEKTSKGAEVQKVTVPQALYNLAGSIKKIEQSSFLLEASIPKLDDNNQVIQKTEIRKVLITPLTRFSSLTFITQEGRKIPQETKIKFQDLRMGDYVEVISNQDISQKQEFEATQIRILPKNF